MQTDGSSHLVNIPLFQPTQTDSNPSLSFFINSLASESCNPTSPEPLTKLTTLDLVTPSSLQRDLIKHTFPRPGPKSRPVRIEVNGRKGRRAVCVLYADGLRYEVFDLDAEVEDGEEEEEEIDEV